MGFNYKGTHAANRTGLLQDPPNYKEVIRSISESKMKIEERAALGCLLMTGARISELLNTQQKSFKFFWNTGAEGTAGTIIDLVDYDNLRKVRDDLSFEKVVISMKILKQRQDAWKKVTCFRNEVFKEPFDWLTKYFKTLRVDSEEPVFHLSRGQMWWRCKRYLGLNTFNHWFRHIAASNDVASGMNIALVQNKLGHKNISSMNTYLHMRTQDVEDALKKAYGGSLQSEVMTPHQLMGAAVATCKAEPALKLAKVVPDRSNEVWVKKKAIEVSKIVKKPIEVSNNDILQVV